MSRLKGEINSEEKQALEAKILELKKTMDEKKSTLSLLESQIKKLHVIPFLVVFPSPDAGSTRSLCGQSDSQLPAHTTNACLSILSMPCSSLEHLIRITVVSQVSAMLFCLTVINAL
jgi:hypothetical protein